MKTLNTAVSIGFTVLLHSTVANAQQSVKSDVDELTLICSQSDIAEQSSETYIPRKTADMLAEKEKWQKPLYTPEEAKKLIEFALNEHLCGLKQEGIYNSEKMRSFKERLVSFLDNTINDGKFSHTERFELSTIAREVKKFIRTHKK